jgi:hypothetical protein
MPALQFPYRLQESASKYQYCYYYYYIIINNISNGHYHHHHNQYFPLWHKAHQMP